ncbi:MAG: protein kinase [Elusimicrobia bacterium]|nr:protein kinase [Elusimicrobiota bacterium]
MKFLLLLAALSATSAPRALAGDFSATERSILPGHGGPLTGLVFSPDGRFLLSAGGVQGAGDVRLWDVAGGRLRQQLSIPAKHFPIALSSDGKTLAASPRGSGSGIHILDMASGSDQELAVGSHQGDVRAQFSPDGRSLAWESGDRALSIWDLRTRSQKVVLTSPLTLAGAIAFSPNGRVIAASCRDRVIRVWNVETGALFAQFPVTGVGARALAFSPDGRALALLHDDGGRSTLALLDMILEKSNWTLDDGLQAARDFAGAVAFSPDGRRLAFTGSEGGVVFVDSKSGRRLGVIAGRLWNGKAMPVNELLFAPDGGTLAVAGADGEIHLFAVTAVAEPAAVAVASSAAEPPKTVQSKPAVDRPLEAAPSLPGAGAATAPNAPSSPADPPPQSDARKGLLAALAALALAGAAFAGWSGSSEHAPSAPPEPGSSLIGGKYELRGQIGSGGMGIVLEGYDRTLSRKVAIKKMRPEIRSDRGAHEQFIAEARIIAQVTHPYIVGIHEIVEDGEDTYLVLDFVDGKPLSAILLERPTMTLRECSAIFSFVCEALRCAHRSHVLHRDLKPSNIMIDKQGFAKVMDFGIARQVKESVSRISRDVSGTPAYMAPEQHLGRTGQESDVYSLGVCLFEMLTGELPFKGPDFLAQKERRLYPSPRSLAPALPEGIESLMASVLEPEPGKRMQDAAQLLQALKRL